MNYCNHCGVELDSEMNYCPLCGHRSNVQKIPVQKKTEKSEPNITITGTYDLNELTHTQKRKVFWELSSIILVSGVVVSFIIDLIINKEISWSKYTITIGLFLFFIISLISFLHERIFILLAGCFVTTSIFLLMLDLFNQNLGWGIKLGIPIIFIIYLIVFILWVVVRKTRQKGINIIAYFLIAIGIMGLCIEGILSLHLFDRMELGWSVILLVSLLAASSILLFIHYRLRRATDLKKFFHI